MAATLSCLTLVATAGCAGAVYLANGLTNEIQVGSDGNFQSVSNVQPGAPINIVLMGSDTREGKGNSGKYGSKDDIAGARSDTTIILHISGDRQRAMAVSIPRDSRVTLPTCKAADGTTKGGVEDRFNAAFENGGPGCTVKAVQELTGIPIDHYVVVDFAGFKGVVEALDGVDVCLKHSVNDPDSRLVMAAGNHTVRGDTALAFVRARKQIGDGSDLGRIERQQEFLSSAIRKATSAGVVTNPAQLYSVLQAAAKSITTDPALANFDSMKDLALQMSEIKPSSIVFATVPTTYDDNFSTVSWVPSESKELFDALKYDQEWPIPPTTGLDGQPLRTAPADILINVQNASGITGEGTKYANILADERYQIGSITSASKKSQSVILYNPKIEDQAEAARTLSYATGVPTRETSSQTGTAITLLVGTDIPGTLKPVVATPKPSPAINGAKPRSAEKKICSEGGRD